MGGEAFLGLFLGVFRGFLGILGVFDENWVFLSLLGLVAF